MYIDHRSFGKRSWARNRLSLEDLGGHNQYADWRRGLWLQAESVVACSNVRLMAKDGVDCISFGPMDLIFDTEGYLGRLLKDVDLDKIAWWAGSAIKETDECMS